MPNPMENPMLESTLVTPDHGDTTTIPIMITGASLPGTVTSTITTTTTPEGTTKAIAPKENI
jgi:hypothetical protein